MPKIKVIKKIESKIKEIKVEKKETLEEEVEEIESEDSEGFSRIRRFGATSTLAQSEVPQETRTLQRATAEEDEKINFRPSYKSTGNPYAPSVYAPVNSAESAAVQSGGTQAESTLQNQDRFIARQEMQPQEQSRPERNPESSYEPREVNRDEQKERERRRHTM